MQELFYRLGRKEHTCPDVVRGATADILSHSVHRASAIFLLLGRRLLTLRFVFTNQQLEFSDLIAAVMITRRCGMVNNQRRRVCATGQIIRSEVPPPGNPLLSQL